jgi:SAM-dependent methyltransferase
LSLRQLKRPKKFSERLEAEYQLRRWKPKDLVKGRRMITREYRAKPWLLAYYRSLLSPDEADAIRVMLDVGCGTGFFTRFVSHQVARLGKRPMIVGADLNRDLLAMALNQSDGPPIDYVQASAYHLPFRTGSFDLATCRTMLMHLSSPVSALEEMKRSVKVGGRVCSEEPDFLMGGWYDPEDPESDKEDRRELEGQIRGRRRMYGQDWAIGRRLPELFHAAGLKNFIIEGTFYLLMVPSDARTPAKAHARVLEDNLKYSFDRSQRIDQNRALRAGGIAQDAIDRNLARWRTKTKKRIQLLKKSQSAKEEDASFGAIPFFLAVGTKLD